MEDEKKFDSKGHVLDDPSLRGLKRYFNNSTIRGRANVRDDCSFDSSIILFCLCEPGH